MKLQILGCYAATPRSSTNPSAQIIDIKGDIFLIDCGEGTQVQLRKSAFKFSRINHIFISHLHGDHFFGLPGLVSTFRLLGRDKELHIYGPKGIQEVITLLLKLGDSWTNYKLTFHVLESKKSELIYENDKVTVETIPLKHRVYTNGFLFKEKLGERKLNIESVEKFKIDKAYYQNIKNGKNITLDDSQVILNTKLTFDPPKPKSYAYCSDTAYLPEIVSIIKGVDTLYHESTFLESEAHLSDKTKHATAKEAAAIAKAAGVGELILGHYSTRYKSIEPFKEEAQEVFQNVSLADDGKIFEW